MSKTSIIRVYENLMKVRVDLNQANAIRRGHSGTPGTMEYLIPVIERLTDVVEELTVIIEEMKS